MLNWIKQEGNVKNKFIVFGLTLSLIANTWLFKQAGVLSEKEHEASVVLMSHSDSLVRSLNYVRTNLDELESNPEDLTRRDFRVIYFALTRAYGYTVAASSLTHVLSDTPYFQRAAQMHDLTMQIGGKYLPPIERIMDAEIQDISQNDIKLLMELRDRMNNVNFPKEINLSSEWDSFYEIMDDFLKNS
jgi:hypothetical protein